jgi:LDH2 family malate/lactate/ureidoglycolate dehydrogenase
MAPGAKLYPAADLRQFACRLFEAAGCDADKAATMAELLLEADLMGHSTHGLALAADYLEELASGAMRARGEPEVIADRGAAVTWDGLRLPGVWLTARAVDLAIERSSQFGIGTVAIRNSHHIACLAVYLERATRQNKMLLIASSDPSDASIAPFGGLKAVFTPDPIAVGIPTPLGPILIDMSSSITTNGMTGRLRKEGRHFPGQWAQTAEGVATDDPNALFAEPPGTLLPIGGKDHGHKGYGLALTVEALTQGLSGYGRSHRPTGWGASLFVQAMDPELYGGMTAFAAETHFLAKACRSNPPAPGFDAVRLPGDKALANKAAALRVGVRLYPGIMEALAGQAERLGVGAPTPVD